MAQYPFVCIMFGPHQRIYPSMGQSETDMLV